MTCGEKIRYLRKEIGLTQTGLAKKVGLQFGTISKYEKDSISIPAENLSKIADVLNTTTDYLLGRTNEPNKIYQASSYKDAIDSDIDLAKLAEIDKDKRKAITDNINNMINMFYEEFGKKE